MDVPIWVSVIIGTVGFLAIIGAAIALVNVTSKMTTPTDEQREHDRPFVTRGITSAGALILGLLLLGFGLGMATASDPPRVDNIPACLAEDGGPASPCKWYVGVTENGLVEWIVFEELGAP